MATRKATRKNSQMIPRIGAHAIPEYVRGYVNTNENNPKPDILILTYEEGRGDTSLYSLMIVKPEPKHTLNDSVKGFNLEDTATNEFEASDIARRIIHDNQCMVRHIALVPLNSRVSGYQLYSKKF